MIRKRTISGVLIVSSLLCCLTACKSQVSGPNVILIVVDTLRADHVGCYGYQRETTPNIDRLAEESLVFKKAISAAPWTAPSLACLMTSISPAVLGYTHVAPKLDEEILTLAEIFKQNRYVSKGIISHVFASSSFGFDQGFDSYDQENAKGHGHVSSPSITEKAVSFIEDLPGERFFLFLHYFDPHHNYILHEDFNFYPDYDGPLYSGQSLIREIRKIAQSLSAEDIEYLKALYDSEIRFTDFHLGILFERLKEKDLYEDTLIVLTSDHGEEFCERGDYWIGHTKTLYQELIHVPLILKLPGQRNQKIFDQSVGLIDLMPTLVNYLSLEVPQDYEYDGEIIDLEIGDRFNSKGILSETQSGARLRSLIKEGWKLIMDLEHGKNELFYLSEDPIESQNLVNDMDEQWRALDVLIQNWEKYFALKKFQLNLGEERPDLTPAQIEILKSLGYIK